jgi:photosystem II stability/assembly factor-like uncharacterized protein
MTSTNGHPCAVREHGVRVALEATQAGWWLARYGLLAATVPLAFGCGAAHPAHSAKPTDITNQPTGIDSGSAQVDADIQAGPGGCATDAAPPPPPANTTEPAYTAGTWLNLTPSQIDLQSMPAAYGITWIEIDPNSPERLYLSADQKGVWRSLDAGQTWSRLGNPPAMTDYGNTVTYLDSPMYIRVDPNDSTHIYVTQGVRGVTLGFWVSHDAGATWTRPAGFLTAVDTVSMGATAMDVTAMDVDPMDFCHILIAAHAGWSTLPGNTSGIFESKDAGETWTPHLPPNNTAWISGTKSIHFLHRPDLNLGDESTWLLSDDNGFWRTTDAGGHWTEVFSKTGSPHGGSDIYYTAGGTLYAGASTYPLRSTDNGQTWTQITMGLPYAYYYSLVGDGTNLFTQPSLRNGMGPQMPYNTSLESDGLNWTNFNGGTQTFIDGPYLMRYDKVNHIMYSANWTAGLWALKTP